MRLGLRWACAPALFLCGSIALPGERKTVQPADIVDVKKVSDPQISPDGKLVAYVIETPVKSGEPKNAHIWLATLDGTVAERPFVMSARADTAPRWSPDGKILAFLSDRVNPCAGTSGSFALRLEGVRNRSDLEEWSHKEESHKHDEQIWAISLSGGEAYPLTDMPGGVKSFKWSHDGKSIVFVRTDGDIKADKERKEHKNDYVIADTSYHFDRLWKYNLAEHTATLVTNADLNVDDFDLSPDGTKAVARISATPRLNDYWYVSKIAVIDLNSGAITRTITEDAAPEHVQWLRSGDKILYGRKTRKGIAGLPTVLDLATGKTTQLGADYDATFRAGKFDADGKGLVLAGVHGTRCFFAHADLESGQIRTLGDVIAEGSDFTRSEDGKIIAYLGQTYESPNDVWIYPADGSAKQLSHANPQTSGWSLGRVREIKWISSKDKREVYGVLVLPPGYTEGIAHKTVVHAHGGPFEAWQSGWLGTWYEWAQLLASHGYVVLAPNPRGSQGQGPSFQEANFEDWGGGDFQDVMDGVDMLVKGNIADPNRLGIGGWSYGGFMTSWAITHTDRFKAAVVGAAVTDLYGMSTTTDIAPSFLDEFFGNFAAHSKLYDAHSPMRYIEQCHTPTLVLHGDADLRVPAFQGAEFYKGLRLFAREAEFVHYPREPHIFTEREHQIDSLQRIVDWFDKHIAQ